MTRDDVIRWAREAGLNTWHAYPPSRVAEQWQCFASLVAADAIAKEREACAALCADTFYGNAGELNHELAAAIRARSTP